MSSVVLVAGACMFVEKDLLVASAIVAHTAQRLLDGDRSCKKESCFPSRSWLATVGGEAGSPRVEFLSSCASVGVLRCPLPWHGPKGTTQWPKKLLSYRCNVSHGVSVAAPRWCLVLSPLQSPLVARDGLTSYRLQELLGS